MNSKYCLLALSMGIVVAAAVALSGCGHRAYRKASPTVSQSAGSRPERAAPTGEMSSAQPSADGDYVADVADVADTAAPRDRPGLGTTFGEQVHSRITHTRFERLSTDPFAQLIIHYNDEEGVRAQANYRRAELREARAHTPHGGISVALTDGAGRALPGAEAGDRIYVVGQDQQRYNLVVRNDTGGRFEVVASVDGLDVVDGEPAGFTKRGYILAPFSTLIIDGFRTSESSVAAFRFGAVRDSYAARTGNDRNVGVIGVAFFAERGSRWTSDELHRRDSADPFPTRYAQPPRY